MAKKKMPFGLWPSRLSPEIIGMRKRIDDVQWHQGMDELIWEENRSGQTTLVSMSEGSTYRELLDNHSPKGGVGYGGGTFTALDGEIVFAEKDQRLYRMSRRFGNPKAITPTLGGVAAPVISPDHEWVVYVASDGKDDVLAAVPMDGSRWPIQLVQGSDFYMQPCWHPQGTAIAWVEWDHPQMPWEGTRLCLGHLNKENRIYVSHAFQVDGDEKKPATQPQFSPDGRFLSYIIQKEEWDELVLFDLESTEKNALVVGKGHMISEPAWVQGVRSYGWSPDSKRIYFFKVAGSFVTLWQVDVATGEQEQIPTEPYTYLKQISVSTFSGEVAVIASASNYPPRVMKWDGECWKIVVYSTSDLIDPKDLPVCEEISWKAANGSKVYGLYYAPHNQKWKGDGNPPVFVNVHGGPTSCAMATYSPSTAYFTSRGYAWLELNHRGSSNYGRTYMEMLRGVWGSVDVEDAMDAARELSNRHLGDASRMVIRGGSAGGYTVLNTLVHSSEVFAAGISLYGISNLFAIATDTHKFEAHYQDTLIGKLPKAAKKYRAWSAVFHADQIQDPLMIFQGDVDTVVPPNQSEQIVQEIKKQGIPYLYKVYEGEGHGFRQTENIVDSICEIEKFMMQHVLFKEE
ncbi:MAG: S9 family peptidase [Anaerolineaceae bacterium]|nr:S9 family peptidase [Anaerolineaceae bacterium]